jgi:Mrp family chromosome partitioning ATPase
MNEQKKQGIFSKVKPHQLSSINKTFAILSGKGGVGKTMVTCGLAVELNRLGVNVGILDSDVTGPSIPHAFKLENKAEATGEYILPALSSKGIQIMSANLLLDNREDPILWRGPLIGDLVRQFYTDVYWQNVDILLIDMPPGTSDIALTTFQMIPVDGIIVVTSPQDSVSLIVAKALKMAEMLKIQLVGIIENFSYYTCPHCHNKIKIYASDKTNDLCQKHNVPLLTQIPIRSEIASAIDNGEIEKIEIEELGSVAKLLTKFIKNKE